MGLFSPFKNKVFELFSEVLEELELIGSASGDAPSEKLYLCAIVDSADLSSGGEDEEIY